MKRFVVVSGWSSLPPRQSALACSHQQCRARRLWLAPGGRGGGRGANPESSGRAGQTAGGRGCGARSADYRGNPPLTIPITRSARPRRFEERRGTPLRVLAHAGGMARAATAAELFEFESEYEVRQAVGAGQLAASSRTPSASTSIKTSGG